MSIKVKVWSAVQEKLKFWFTMTSSPEVVSPVAVLTTRASPETPRPVPARTDSAISKSIVSVVSFPVIEKLLPVAVRLRVSVALSATGSVPLGALIVSKLLVEPPASVLQAQTLVPSFHFRISLLAQP